MQKMEMSIRRRTEQMRRRRPVQPENVKQNVLHRQRITCADSLETVQAQDWTNGMKMSPSGRFQIIEEAKPHRKIITRQGIRWDAAWGILAAVAVLCTVILLADIAGMGIGARSINNLTGKIHDYMEKNEQLRTELAVSTNDVNVCTEAVKLNLISGYAAQTVQLTAPEAGAAAASSGEGFAQKAGRLTGTAGD